MDWPLTYNHVYIFHQFILLTWKIGIEYDHDKARWGKTRESITGFLCNNTVYQCHNSTFILIDKNILDQDENLHHATNSKAVLLKSGETIQVTNGLYPYPHIKIYGISYNIVQLYPPGIYTYKCL